MSLNQEERTAVVTYRLEKAERALMQAKVTTQLYVCSDCISLKPESSVQNMESFTTNYIPFVSQVTIMTIIILKKKMFCHLFHQQKYL